MHPLAAGPLGAAGGVAIFHGLPDAATCQALAAEAYAAYSTSDRQELDRGDDVEGRGGAPARALHSAGGGVVQDALYASPWVSEFLTAQCGAPVAPTGNRGSYSYYAQPGDHLGVHLDIDTCDVTLITVLDDSGDPGSAAGGLVAYPIGTPLAAARAHPGHGGVLVKAQRGQSIVLLGGLVPHEILPVAGQRVISALCFAARC